MKNLFRSFALLVSLLSMFAIFGGTSQAAPVQTMAPITGEIEAISITTPGNIWSGGMMRVGGQDIILPANLLINLPNDYQTLQQLYDNAPAACRISGETGLAKIDGCNGRATGAQASILANRSDSGNVIAAVVDIFKAVEVVNGTITYIDYNDGYFRVNGIPGDATTGVMIRVNDPTTRHTIQKGLGCSANTAAVNCSPDVRFKIDPDNYTFCYITGYPACIPTTVNGLNDANCPDTNRPAPPVPAPAFPAPVVAANSIHFAPIKLGDSIKADGSFETVSGVTFLSASSVRVMVDLTTRTTDAFGIPDPTQVDYLIITEAGWDGPAYHQGRVRGRFLTNSTLHNALGNTEIDYYSVHYDPVSNAPHEQILYTTQGNKQQGAVIFNVPTGVFDSQIRMDFFPAAKIIGDEPCVALTGNARQTVPPRIPVFSPPINLANYCTGTGTSIAENFNLMVPAFREVMAHSLRERDVTGVALDIQGRPTQSGHYKLPVTLEYGAFEDVNLGLMPFPTTFSGTPWLMDRRLSPNGCSGACEAAPQPLTPFPFEGIDPRAIASIYGIAGTQLPNPNRMFNFMVQDPATGAFNLTGLLAWPPVNPPAFPITPIPPFSLFPPIADEDAATTRVGVPVIINVLANDVSLYGTIDPTTVQIATQPVSGTVQVNLDGTITYIPTPTFTVGTVTFTYTVANNFGSVSLPGTVTVTIVVPPTAVNDAATAPAGSSVYINVAANDIAGTSIINLASVNIVGTPTCGTLVNKFDGVVQFIAPAAVPAGGICTFSYLISDTSLPALTSNIATVTVTITAPIAPPVAVNDTATTPVGSATTINLIANDTSTSSTINPASILVTLPTGTVGTVVVNANGTVTYTAPAAAGVYTFAYTVKDNLVPPLTSNPATVTVTVIDTLPVARNDTASVLTSGTATINVITNDTSATNTINPASITIVTPPTGGIAAANPDGTVTYTAPAVPGSYVFTYTVQDNAVPPATSNAASVSVAVAAPVSPPIAVDDAAAMTGGAGTNVAIDVLANDVAGSNAISPASVVIVSQPLNGSALVSSTTGTVTYTPTSGFVGADTFTYNVKDIVGTVSNTATVTVTVNAPAVESLAVTLAQFIVTGSEWRVEGTTTSRTPGETIGVFNSATVPADGVTDLIGTATVDQATGVWVLDVLPGPPPNAVQQISVQSSLGQKLEGITVVVR